MFDLHIALDDRPTKTCLSGLDWTSMVGSLFDFNDLADDFEGVSGLSLDQ